MDQDTTAGINRLWSYLSPLGEERTKMFVHLMQVNNKKKHFQQGFEFVKRDIIRKNYELTPVQKKERENFNKVLVELLDRKEEQRQQILLMSQKPLEIFDRCLLKPSKLFNDYGIAFPSFKMIKAWEGKEPQEIHSWGVQNMTNFFDEEYSGDVVFNTLNKENAYDYTYEEEMDVLSSLQFALDYILVRSNSAIRGFNCDTKLPVPVCETVKSLTSCIKKLDKELTDAYLRGVNDTRKLKKVFPGFRG